LKGGLIDNEETIIRKRPHGDLLRRTLGYVKPRPNNDPLKIGLEGAFNDYLKGEPGEEIEQKITTGWKKIGQVTKEAVEGADVITTFDIEIQEVAHSELLTQLRSQGAENGCVIVMDVKTGFVKAMVNLTRGKDGKYYESFNHAIATKEVPGSTFKLASLMALLEDKKATIKDIVNATGEYKYYGFRLTDSRKWGYGEITLQHAFEKSSNVISKVVNDAYKDKPEDFVERIKSFGLGQKLGVSIPGEVEPTIPEPGDGKWSGISLPWMSIGYEVQQTPLHTLAFYNAVANDGVFMRPGFVKEIRRGNQLIEQFEPEVIQKDICSKSTLNDLKTCLEGVVERGTGSALKSAYFKIAGKTGTAVTTIAGAKTEKKYQASFVGYFPADDPIYSCIVVVAAPTREIYGAVVSGTVFTAIANKVYASKLEYHEPINSRGEKAKEIPVSADGNRYDLIQSYKKLGIPFNSSTDKPWVTTKTGEDKVELQERYADKSTVPNVMGMTAKDAVYLIESTGMVVKINGYGKVVSQSMDPGTPVFKGGIIQIELK
jgi:cell division protein FtsI (penicillin-binding protein 3)